MKIPSQITEISVYEDHAADYPYPPAGWLPFWEHELGNGDMFGLQTRLLAKRVMTRWSLRCGTIHGRCRRSIHH